MKRSVLISARLMEEQLLEMGGKPGCIFITLTYKEPDAWRPRHITDLIKCYREYFRLRKQKLYYLWVAEIQPKRYWNTGKAVVHYHLLIWIPYGVKIKPPLPDKRGWWKHGDTRAEWARNPVGYLVSYLKKGELTQLLPPGCRIYACGGLNQASQIQRRWELAPIWLKN